MLGSVAVKFLECWNIGNDDVHAICGEDEWKAIWQAYDMFARFCRLVGELFLIEGIDSNPADVDFFVDYNGPNVFARAVKGALKPRVDDKADKRLTADQQADRKWLSEVLSDCLKTAGSAPALLPDFQRAKECLSRADEASPDQLQEIFALLPKFKSGLRKGRGAQLESRLAEALCSRAGSIMDGSTDLANVTTDMVAFLVGALAKCPAEKGCLEMHGKLSSWLTKFGTKLAGTDAIKWSDGFVKARKHSERTGQEYDGPALNVEQLTATLRKCGASVSDTVVLHLSRAMYFLARDFRQEASRRLCGVATCLLEGHSLCSVSYCQLSGHSTRRT